MDNDRSSMPLITSILEPACTGPAWLSGARSGAFAARLLPTSILRPLSRLAARRSLYAGSVPGASEKAHRVKTMNANWIAGADGGDGHF